MDLGKRIRNRRLELDLTLEQVGKMVGVTKSTVRKWETGYIEHMKRNNIAMLAEALKVSPLWVMGIEDKSNSEEVREDEVEYGTTSELERYFEENKEKLSSLSKEDSEKLIKLIDVYLD